jgi:type IV secretory pathway TrbF-like protein
MKLRNVILIAGGGMLLAAIGAGIWLYSSLDSLVKSAIETYGRLGKSVTHQRARHDQEPAAG